MNEFITLAHKLPYFNVTAESEWIPCTSGGHVVKTPGIITLPTPEYCPKCEAKVHNHSYETVKIKDIPLMKCPHILEVKFGRHKCSECGTIFTTTIPFKSEHHFITERLEKLICGYLSIGMSMKLVHRLTGVDVHIIKDIDKAQLEKKYDLKTLKDIESVRFLAVDEIAIHKHHNYATVFMNLENGHIVYCEQGKKKDQVLHFIQKVGKKWLKNLVAVAMDMNAGYDQAFSDAAPHVQIVYDNFHMIKMYGDLVLTAIRRRLQLQARERGDERTYSTLKGSRFLLLTNRQTLKEKDKTALENNRELLQNYELKGVSLPPGRRYMRCGNEAHLNGLLSVNRELYIAYILKEQFQVAYDVVDADVMKQGLRDWIQIARQSKVPEILKFCNTVESHLDGISNHAKFNISTGKLEGTNNLAKVIKRTAYGFHDDEYYFLKLMDASRRPYYKPVSHKFLQ